MRINHISKRSLIYFAIIDVLLIGGALWYVVAHQRVSRPIGLEGFTQGTLRVSSPAFEENGPIPVRYACKREGGDEKNPPLAWTGVPPEAKSLVLVVDDPDAPLGGFTHWTLWNIPVALRGIKDGIVPPGAVQGANGARQNAYQGLCPPDGAHQYQFKLYALDTVMQLPVDTDSRTLERVIASHVMSRAATVGTFRKP